MALEEIHIKPVAPDPNASERYGSFGERPHRERAPREEEEAKRPADRLEISDFAKRYFRLSVASADEDFARKALDRLPALSPERNAQIVARLESGYYDLPMVLDRVASRLIGENE
jgi:hypothetical protein